ncbi:ABC transporter substrate-binding protein [Rubrobacter aplysinae]|uniref:ABC transporter substrate-binding protein n=1 Tax=Rubrobacter aplysinae TaxID=909625 RepID=UPI00064C4423|nr:ABC transporter substrate-binding protein [Rubrobacter aplysinae]
MRRWIPLCATLVALALTLAACGDPASSSSGSSGDEGETRSFSELEDAARGTEVNITMYGGDEATNEYVDEWAAPRLEEQYGIELKRTPVADTADAVNKLLNEKQAGGEGGSVDLVWLNGENFATGADADLWYGPWAERLPNADLIDWDSPGIRRDFGYPVEGREAPWGKAQFVMIYDSDEVDDPPRSMDELKQWVADNPGEFAYPSPPDFTGNAFVEHVLYELGGGPEPFQKPFDREVFDEAAPAVYEYLNELEPDLWRSGETYPESSTALEELYQNGEISLSMSYNPNLAQRQIEKGLYPESTRTYLFEDGTLSNTHYVAVPFNSQNKAGAQVVANFLESPEAQAAKQDPDTGWGDLPAIEVDRLPEAEQEPFEANNAPAALSNEELQENQLPEARTEWLLELEDGWQNRVLEE